MMSLAKSVELHRHQQVFRSVLDAFAQPGTVHAIEPEPGLRTRPAALYGALEAVLRVFVDQAVSFCVVDVESAHVERYVVSETHAKPSSVQLSNFVVVSDRSGVSTAHRAVLEACGGSLISPEKGATVLVGCSCLVACANESASVKTVAKNNTALYAVEVRGPGVRDVNSFLVDRVAWAEARALRGDEFPCGIEIVLVDSKGNVVAVPRSSRIEVRGTGETAGAALVSAPADGVVTAGINDDTSASGEVC